MSWEMRWHGAVLIAGLALIVWAIVASVQSCNKQRACRDAGGRVEKYDCETSYITQSCGSGCFYTIPVTSCQWRCVDVPAERP